MKSRRVVKENIPAPPRTPSMRTRQSTNTTTNNPEFDAIFGSPMPSEHEGAPNMMLSPPPEEELRYTRRPSNEPSSASKPLASTLRTNQQPSGAVASSSTSKRKRTITGPTQSPIQPGTTHTPNPRQRKVIRASEASPTPSRIASGSQANVGGGFPGSSTRSRVHLNEDSLMSPTRRGKSTRDQHSHLELVSESPYAENSNADYIPPERLAFSPKGVSVKRRSGTPIPPYEPPPEKYTPPREIVLSPTRQERKPAKRAGTRKKRNSGDKQPPPLRIKTEPPEIDLNKPVPPASPGDDPILLVGPPALTVQRPSMSPTREAHSFVNFEMDLDLPERERQRSRVGSEPVVTTPHAARSSSIIPPVFDFSNLPEDNGWMDSSSDGAFVNLVELNTPAGEDGGWITSDEEEDQSREISSTTIGRGEYTGKYIAYRAPIKPDPPTREELERMEEWGRPISPYPRKSLGKNGTEAPSGPPEAETAGTKNTDGKIQQSSNQETGGGSRNEEEEQEGDKTPVYRDKRGRRLTLSELESIKFGPQLASTPKAFGTGPSHTSSESDASIESIMIGDNQESTMAVVPDQEMLGHEANHNLPSNDGRLLSRDHESNAQTENINVSTANSNQSNTKQHSSEEPHSGGESSSQATLNDQTANFTHLTSDKDASLPMNVDYPRRGSSSDNNNNTSLRVPAPPDADLSGLETELEGDTNSENESDEGIDLGVIKIMSDDPMAAARAAAILKMHDYDMLSKKMKRRKSHSGGVAKGYSSPRKTELWRRRTIAGLSGEADLTANVSLPDLLERAEEELRSSPTRSRTGSVAASLTGSPQKGQRLQEYGLNHNLLYEDADVSGIREWTKADWKLLDSCFTDERFDLGEEQGREPGDLAPVEDVRMEDVVDRFVDLMGGAAKVEGHGPSWTREKLISRSKALCKRQRAGEGAPPTPDVSIRFATPSRYATRSPSQSSMILPDFTPTVGSGRTRLFDTATAMGSVSRKAALPPPSSEPFFKVPPLPARFSRLRDEVSTSPVGSPDKSQAVNLFGFATPTRSNRGRDTWHEDQSDGSVFMDDDSDEESVVEEVETMLTPVSAARMRNSRPSGAVRRSLNYITSWLKPDMYKSRSEEPRSSRLGLPPPPPDILSKHRGPVETPAPKPLPRVVPPKDQVSLEHINPPESPRRSRSSRTPRRLVDLQHVPTPESKEPERHALRRRSSTSVRDLVKEYEQKDASVKRIQVLPPRVAELRRQGSMGSLRSKGKPTWKP